VILRCNYEELSALKQGAHTLLGVGEGDRHVAVAPPAAHATVAALLPRLEGDLTITTLEQLYSVQIAIDAIVICLRAEMESAVTITHPADEYAVAAYFDFAHAFTVLARVREMGAEMEALIEVVTGGVVTPDIAREFVFPD